MFNAALLFSSIMEWTMNFIKKYMNLLAYSYYRLHAQALTLAALAGAAVVEYYDHKSGIKADRYAKFLDMDTPAHKDWRKDLIELTQMPLTRMFFFFFFNAVAPTLKGIHVCYSW